MVRVCVHAFTYYFPYNDACARNSLLLAQHVCINQFNVHGMLAYSMHARGLMSTCCLRNRVCLYQSERVDEIERSLPSF